MNKVLIIIILLLITYLFRHPTRETGKKKNRKGEVALFSAVKGNINLKGVSLPGIKLIRTYPEIGKGDEVSETIYTDENGDFSFEEVIGHLGIMRFLPHEAVIHQQIQAEYLDKKYLLWYTCKRNYEPLGEFIYNKREPILPREMIEAYKEGHISINCDLINCEDFVQKVNDNITFISIVDFNFPYELALKAYAQVLLNRKDEFTNEIREWFENHPQYFDILNNGDAMWSDMELEDLAPYLGVVIDSVDSVLYSDHIRLEYFEEDYNEDSTRVTISGEILLNVINTKGETLKARVWLSDSLFKVSREGIVLQPQDHYFVINSANIDPDIID